MIAYEDILSGVKEWKDGYASTESTSPSTRVKKGGRQQLSTGRISSILPAIARPKLSPTDEGVAASAGAHRGTDTACGTDAYPYHHPHAPSASLSPRRSDLLSSDNNTNKKKTAISPKRFRNNIIPLRQAVTPRGGLQPSHKGTSSSGRGDEECDEDPYEMVSTPRGWASAGGDGVRNVLRRSTIERLSTPRCTRSNAATGPNTSGGTVASSSSDYEKDLVRSESFKKSLREIEEQKAKAREKPGALPFVIGGTAKNAGWHKHLPTPPGLEAIRKEVRDKHEKGLSKEEDVKLLARLTRWPNRPQAPCAPPQEPLNEEEEAELVKRLYFVRLRGGEDEEEDEGEGSEHSEIDIEEQVDRLYYKAMERRKRNLTAAGIHPKSS